MTLPATTPRTFASRSDPWVLTFLLVICIVAVGWWPWQGRGVDLPEVSNARLQCTSYAPYRLPGETPYDPLMKVSEARVREDLTMISKLTDCVRTYSVNQGLDLVPKVAGELNMKVLVGAWLGRNRVENEQELDKAIALSKQYPGTVIGLIGGNEVLLRRELPEAELAAYLQRARAATTVPVTYADVWEFWVEHPKLAESVSFVTIHILPYWEDEPVGIDAAIAHVLSITRKMQSLVGDKQILIGETGWPSGGRQRRDAVPGRVEQAKFVRQFAKMAETEHLRYNVIEAFDQPWKRRLEGAMGGYWGLFDSDGVQKFPWTGPVAEIADWRPGLYAAAIGAVLFGLIGLRRANPGRGFGLVVMVLAGAATGAVLAAQWRYMGQWNRDWMEWSASGLYTLVAVALTLLGALRLAARRNEVLPSGAQVLADWFEHGRRPDFGAHGDRMLALLRLVFLAGAAFMAVLMVFDARYRGFPSLLYWLPAAIGLLAWLLGEKASAARHEESLLGLLIALGTVWMVVAERPENGQAMVFAVVLLILAGTATNFRYGLGLLLPRQNTSNPASSPTADVS